VKITDARTAPSSAASGDATDASKESAELRAVIQTEAAPFTAISATRLVATYAVDSVLSDTFDDWNATG
jgi:hypothetical protein